MKTRFLWVFSLPFVAACFTTPAGQGGDGGPTNDAGDTTDGQTLAQSTTWTDGTTLDAPVVIADGVTITIAPGAHVTCGAGVTITVRGTLTASSSSGSHALLAGAGWNGIVVAGAGTLALDGVDITGAAKAIDDGSTTAAKYDNGTIAGAGSPFIVEVGASLSTTHASVNTPTAKSFVYGSFTASYLDYAANGVNAIWSENPAARVFIEDSTFTSNNPAAANDLVNGYGASFFHVAYSDISGAHCGLHFAAVDTLEIDHVTVHDVTNGADLWGSSTATGTRTIASSNFENDVENFDEYGVNGPISVTGCYGTGVNKLKANSVITISSPAATPIAGAGPR